jgi:hypothetical protein
MIDFEKIISSNMIKALFLLILTLSGDFLGGILSCRSQIIGHNNMWIKQLILFNVIYFSINLTENESVHPLLSIKNAFFIWVAFLLFTKQPKQSTTLILILLILLTMFDNYIKYLQNEKKESKKYERMRKYLVNLIIFILVFGFGFYFIRKKQKHLKDFDLIKFLFSTECKGLKN